MNGTIAIVEDDANQRQHYADALREANYEVIEYADRKSAVEGFEKSMPDLAILDIILGDEVGGGFDICRFLKDRNSSLPVIFLTSRGDELDQIYGLQLGAWDYQTKPVSLNYLITRIHSLFQIKQTTEIGPSKQHFGDMLIDDVSMSVIWKQKPVNLTPTEFDILHTIIKTPAGVSIEDLIKATRQGMVEDNTVNTHILHIRKKLKRVDKSFNCIKTRYGYGYCWIC